MGEVRPNCASSRAPEAGACSLADRTSPRPSPRTERFTHPHTRRYMAAPLAELRCRDSLSQQRLSQPPRIAHLPEDLGGVSPQLPESAELCDQLGMVLQRPGVHPRAEWEVAGPCRQFLRKTAYAKGSTRADEVGIAELIDRITIKTRTPCRLSDCPHRTSDQHQFCQLAYLPGGTVVANIRGFGKFTVFESHQSTPILARGVTVSVACA